MVEGGGVSPYIHFADLREERERAAIRVTEFILSPQPAELQASRMTFP